MRTFTITLGTTPINLWLLLTNQGPTSGGYTGASIANSRKVTTPCSPLVNELIILADDANTGTVYGGDTVNVASTDYGFRLIASQEHRMISNGSESKVPLTQWLVGSGAGQKIHVKINW